MKGFDFMKFISTNVQIVIKFFDNAYKEGYGLYMIAFLIVLFVLIIMSKVRG